MVTEKAIRFGRESHLVGVLTLPTGTTGGTGTAAILLNAGLLSRIGPHRLHVRMARHLASRGIPCLRFDSSGLGDSGNPGKSEIAPQIADVADAIDRLIVDGVARNVVLFGICAGAVFAYQAAQVNEHVSGVILHDGFIFPTWKTKLFYVYRKIKARPPLSAILKRKRRVVMNIASDDIPADAYAEGLARIEKRGAWVAHVMSGSYPERYSYHGQFKDRFRRFGLRELTANYLPDVDHTLTTLDAQSRIAALVAEKIMSGSAAKTPAV